MDNQDRLNDFLEEGDIGRPTTIELAKSLVEGKENVNITLRKAREMPVRAESQARDHKFWEVGGFAKFVETYGSKDTVVLANPETGAISAVLDDKAEKGHEVVTFEAKPHPAWLMWEGWLGKAMHVKDFGKFLLTQGHVIVEPDPKIVAQIFAQIRTSKKVELQSGFGAESLNGVMVEVEIRGQAPDKQIVKLPTELTLECPMFVGRPATMISVDIILDARDDKVVVELYSGDAEAKRMEEIEKMLAEVMDALGDKLVTFGNVQHKSWRYVG